MTAQLIRLSDWLRATGLRHGSVVHSIARGELVTYKVNRSVYLDRAQADAWLLACRRPALSQPAPAAAEAA